MVRFDGSRSEGRLSISVQLVGVVILEVGNLIARVPVPPIVYLVPR